MYFSEACYDSEIYYLIGFWELRLHLKNRTEVNLKDVNDKFKLKEDKLVKEIEATKLKHGKVTKTEIAQKEKVQRLTTELENLMVNIDFASVYATNDGSFEADFEREKSELAEIKKLNEDAKLKEQTLLRTNNVKMELDYGQPPKKTARKSFPA